MNRWSFLVTALLLSGCTSVGHKIGDALLASGIAKTKIRVR